MRLEKACAGCGDTACGGRAVGCFDDGQHDNVRRCQKAAAIPAEVAVSGGMDGAVCAHGHCVLPCVYRRCAVGQEAFVANRLRSFACVQLPVEHHFL